MEEIPAHAEHPEMHMVKRQHAALVGGMVGSMVGSMAGGMAEQGRPLADKNEGKSIAQRCSGCSGCSPCRDG